MSRFRGRGRVLTFIKNISLVLSLCNFRDLIYAQSACNTPQRKGNLKSHHMTPLKESFIQTLKLCYLLITVF